VGRGRFQYARKRKIGHAARCHAEGIFMLVIWTGKPASIGCSFLFLFRSWATAIASARQGRNAYGSVGKTRRAPSTLDRRFPGFGQQIDEGDGSGDRRRNLPGRLPRPALPRQRDLDDPQNRRRLTALLGQITPPARRVCADRRNKSFRRDDGLSAAPNSQ
jgi:hypothetical protein